nr:kelch motif-containing protein [Candidatus Dormibacteraeota bacterium]
PQNRAQAAATSLAPTAPPSPRPTPTPGRPLLGSGYAAVEDPSSRRLVVFGGIDSYSTTWLWDGARWSLARPPVSPPGRFRAASTYDPSTRTVMLFGGRLGTGQAADDTWAWDGSTWRQLAAGTGEPPAGEGSVMAWDATRHQVVLTHSTDRAAGETWTWNGAAWTRQAGGTLPPGAFVVALAVDPADGDLLATTCCAPGLGTSGTLAWNGSSWRQVTTPTVPAFTVALALDPVTGHLLLCGDPALGGGKELWSWTGSDWSLLTGARLPVFPEAAVTDATAGHLVILGSFAEPREGSPQPVHVWTWNGSAWTPAGG